MSYENKGSMTSVAVVTHVPDRSGNFVIEAVDDPAVVIETAWAYLNTFGGGTLVTRGAGQTWDILSTIDSQGANITWISDRSLVIRATATVDTELIDIVHDDTTLIRLHLDGNNLDGNYYGIYLDAVTGFVIHQCEIHDIYNTSWGGHAIICTNGCGYGQITENYLHDNGDPLIDDGGTCVYLTDCVYTEVSRNVCLDSNGGIYLMGAASDVTCYNRVLENIILGCVRGGISIYPLNATGDVSYNVVDGNVVIDNGSDGNHPEVGVGTGAGTATNNVVSNNIIGATGDYDRNIGMHVKTPHNSVVGNIFTNTYSYNLYLYAGADRTIVSDNVFDTSRNQHLVISFSDGNVFADNLFANINSNQYGLSLQGSDSLISGNYYYGGSNADGILIDDGSDNLVDGNFFDLPRYGIAIQDDSDNNVIRNNKMTGASTGVLIIHAACNGTVVFDNDFRGCTLPLNDGGTDTVLPMKPFQFTDVTGGSAVVQVASPVGCYVSDAGGTAIAWGQLPIEVQQVVRLKVWAVAKDAPAAGGGQMHCEFTFNAGASNAAYNTAGKSWNVVNKDSEEADYVSDDVIHWVLTDADTGDSEVSALVAGDSFEILAIYEDAASPDGDTDAKFRVVEIEYV